MPLLLLARVGGTAGSNLELASGPNLGFLLLARVGGTGGERVGVSAHPPAPRPCGRHPSPPAARPPWRRAGAHSRRHTTAVPGPLRPAGPNPLTNRDVRTTAVDGRASNAGRSSPEWPRLACPPAPSVRRSGRLRTPFTGTYRRLSQMRQTVSRRPCCLSTAASARPPAVAIGRLTPGSYNREQAAGPTEHRHNPRPSQSRRGMAWKRPFYTRK